MKKISLVLLLILIQLLSGCGDDKPKKITSYPKKVVAEKKVPEAHREYFKKLGITVSPDSEVDFLHSNDGRLTAYSFSDSGEFKGIFYVELNTQGEIWDAYFKHFRAFDMCPESIFIAENKKFRENFKERLQVHITDEKAKNVQELKKYIKVKQ